MLCSVDAGRPVQHFQNRCSIYSCCVFCSTNIFRDTSPILLCNSSLLCVRRREITSLSRPTDGISLIAVKSYSWSAAQDAQGMRLRCTPTYTHVTPHAQHTCIQTRKTLCISLCCDDDPPPPPRQPHTSGTSTLLDVLNMTTRQPRLLSTADSHHNADEAVATCVVIATYTNARVPTGRACYS